ncbi:2-iminobutanoate/2-iminopropanoate deaminase [Mucilaginibacter gracilis]|uniref:2-iminobutanoate/2-iminopropanoate deaminase n=1 Tax=Mucilaginibacter gracilis TaxID=423350 RepID=A0A495JBC1_9SPHI|nr:RidA family protein [Mucilaginibacter gracilis]RKR85662.1 2-iminobutanoate/2-iminopropanoate deaminase [Mucilaginibacter gracilis]
MKTIIKTDKAPAPIGPYNQAILAGNTLYVSGQVAINPVTNEVELNGIEAETHLVMNNIKAILEEAAFGFEDVVKTSIFLSDMGTFAQVNQVYGSYFTGNYPARETVQVSVLPKNVNVEISVIAYKA